MIRNHEPATLMACLILALVLGASIVLGQGGTVRKPTPGPTTRTKPKKTDRSYPPSKAPLPNVKTPSGIEVVWVPAGSFRMGSNSGNPDEKPVHRVRITNGFYMGKFEVTQAQWKTVMGTNPSKFIDDNNPVEQITWDETQEFLRLLNARNDGFIYRLPTEAEWEYACRAGTGELSAEDLDAMAWHDGNSKGTTHIVGQKRPNAFGLYDMNGNVFERCQDLYGKDYYRRARIMDPTGPTSGVSRVVRGGAWNTPTTFMRPAYRSLGFSLDRISTIGFRVVAVTRQSTNLGKRNPTKIDADPISLPPDVRNIPYGDPKSKALDGPADEKLLSAKEVNQKARILEQPAPRYTEEARKNQVAGTVVLRVLLTASGQVTNIRVITGLPDGLTDQAIEAAKRLRFVPALKNGQPVSQYVQLQYTFSSQ